MTAPLSPERETEIRERLGSTLAARMSDVRTLLTELDRLRAELAALPAPVVEQGFRDEFGTVHPLTHFPAETVAEVLKTNPALQRTVRISEWTEVAS
ncbi:hypothetical protein ACFZBE_17810 [Streptomyces sp. NPDC008061]|uniref:hypothetical protein n=1 Tax=Streptomyces sp. NPDC008061 TaxID=3364805 RepID=UPI0036EB15FB